MSLTTIQVQGLVTEPDGDPANGYTLIFQLRQIDKDSALILPNDVEYVVPSDGNIDVSLWSNARGYAGTVYHVYMSPPNTRNDPQYLGTLSLPDVAGPVNIWTYIDVAAPAELSDAQAAEAAALKAAAEAETAANRAEAAEAATTTDVDIYDSTSAGIAATSVDDQFQVVSTDGREIIRYLHDTGSVATELVRYPTSTMFNEEVFETLYSDKLGIIFDSEGDQVGIIEDNNDTTPEDNALELSNAAGDATDLTERLSRSLTDYGDVKASVVNEYRLRNVRRKLRQLQYGASVQCIINIFGDSWVEGNYWVEGFAKLLQDEYGLAGCGWVGFQSHTNHTPMAYTDDTTQPYPVGNARDDLIAAPIFDGTWDFDNGNQPGGIADPGIGAATSSDAGAYIRFDFPANHNAADLYYSGDGTGVVRYSWDGGTTWETSLNLTSTSPTHVALSNVPSTAASLRIEVVSGNVRLAGVYMKSNDNGVRVNSLGASGSNTDHWAAPTLSDLAASIATLDGDLIMGMLATNDQSGGTQASVVADNVEDLFEAFETDDPELDLLWLAPPENVRSTPPSVTMAQYTEEIRKKAVDNNWALLDLQYVFGEDTDNYDKDSGIALLDGTNGHPSTTGGFAITDAILRLISPSL